MRIMDRYLFLSFVAAYLICFTSLVGLYITIDLFSNADEFLKDHEGTVAFVRKATKYYFFHSFEYFARLSPIITMIAAMTTLASLHRYNEIVALLAAGIPTRRALVPILFGVLLVVGLGVANRELVLSRISLILQRLHEDIEENRVLIPAVQIDHEQVLFRGSGAHREDKRLDNVNVTLPEEVVGQLQEIHCANAYYRTDETTGKTGWLLEKPSALHIVRPTEKVKPLPDGNIFLFSNVTFIDMIRKANWMEFASTTELLGYLSKEDAKNPHSIRILIHGRLMEPVLNIILVLIGIPFVLQWERKNIYRSIAVAMLLSGLFEVVIIVSAYFSSFGYVDPMTAAWIPVFTFGPLAFVLFHRMGT